MPATSTDSRHARPTPVTRERAEAEIERLEQMLDVPQRDLERVQRDMTAVAAGKPVPAGRAAAAPRPTRTARRQTAH